MESNLEFNLEQRINAWKEKLKSEMFVTEADTEELCCHLQDLMDELQEKGLDEEEAFLIASRRMGGTVELKDDYQIANNPLIQMQRSLIILAGVLSYFLFYYFLHFSSKLLFVTLIQNDVNGHLAFDWMNKYLIGAQFLFVLFFISIYFFEKKIIKLIQQVTIKPKHTIIVLLVAVLLAIGDTCIFPFIKSMFKDDRLVISHIHIVIRDFNFSFPLIISVSYIVLYFRFDRYHKI